MQGPVFIFPLGSAFMIVIHFSNPMFFYSYTSSSAKANVTSEYPLQLSDKKIEILGCNRDKKAYLYRSLRQETKGYAVLKD